jgi:hypothetical protein
VGREHEEFGDLVSAESFLVEAQNFQFPWSQVFCSDFRRRAIVSGGSDLKSPAGQRASGMKGGRTVDAQSSNLSSQVKCSRWRHEPCDDADYVTWHALDEGGVCPGCLTLLETEWAGRTSPSREASRHPERSNHRSGGGSRHDAA